LGKSTLVSWERDKNKNEILAWGFQYHKIRKNRSIPLALGGPALRLELQTDGLKPGPTFHDLRRTAVRNLIRSAVQRDVAMKISGHETDSISSRCNIVSIEDLRETAIKQHVYLDNQNNSY
jgi:integrase